MNRVEDILMERLSEESKEVLQSVIYCSEKVGLTTQELLNAVIMYHEKLANEKEL